MAVSGRTLKSEKVSLTRLLQKDIKSLSAGIIYPLASQLFFSDDFYITAS